MNNDLIKQRIYQLINNDNYTKEDISNKIKLFVNRITDNTKQLVEILNTIINIKTIQKYEIIDSGDIDFSKYILLPLPLYIIHFMKYCYEIKLKLPENIAITTYHNLLKESVYKFNREINQIILLWKDKKNGKYDVLSIITKDINELDITKKNCFIYEVGGSKIDETYYNWNRYRECLV